MASAVLRSNVFVRGLSVRRPQCITVVLKCADCCWRPIGITLCLNCRSENGCFDLPAETVQLMMPVYDEEL